MTEPTRVLPVQLLAARSMIDAFSEESANASVEVQPLELTTSDQRFGVTEVGAILALVHSAAQAASLLIDAYKKLRRKEQVVVKTPKGSVTLDLDEGSSVESVTQKLRDIGLL